MALTRESLFRAAAVALLPTLMLSGCAALEPESRFNQIELQEDLERFAGLFVERVAQSTEAIVSSPDVPRKVRVLAMRQLLLYATAAFDIAAGRFPEVNLLDMLAFVELSAATIDEYWIPDVFGEAGRPLQVAFAHSAEDLKLVAEKVLRPEQQEEVHQLVAIWRRDNPDQRGVESVRLFGFSETTGRLASERMRKMRGLLASVKGATRSADQGLLLAERALFLAQRIPFLLRLHVRLGAQQLLDDVLPGLEPTEVLPRMEALPRTSDLRPLLDDATILARRAAEAATEARALLDGLGPLLEPHGVGQETLDRVERTLDGADRALSAADRLTDRSILLLEDARAGAGHLFIQLAAVGALLVALFWGGYVVAARLV